VKGFPVAEIEVDPTFCNVLLLCCRSQIHQGRMWFFSVDFLSLRMQPGSQKCCGPHSHTKKKTHFGSPSFHVHWPKASGLIHRSGPLSLDTAPSGGFQMGKGACLSLLSFIFVFFFSVFFQKRKDKGDEILKESYYKKIHL